MTHAYSGDGAKAPRYLLESGGPVIILHCKPHGTVPMKLREASCKTMLTEEKIQGLGCGSEQNLAAEVLLHISGLPVRRGKRNPVSVQKVAQS